MSNTATTSTTEGLPPPTVREYPTFDEMDLPDDLAHGICSYGFDRPSSIQRYAIVPMKEHRDILAQSQSGTGKTGAFVIGSLSCVDKSVHAPQVLIISPVRELAQQTERVANAIGQYMELKTLVATGGNPLRDDAQVLRDGAQVIVGTPGRIYDLLRRGDFQLEHMRVVILDEADQMLDELFADQIKSILEFRFPDSTQLALFSATMPADVLELAERFLRNPVRILLPPDQVTLKGISQYHVPLDREEWKFDVLLDLYQHLKINQAFIYVNKRQKAEILAKRMTEAGFTLECIHGEMPVAERKKRMDDFRRGNVRVLISTDLLARGIDVQQVSVVINFELPTKRENYIHRIGRSGRFARKGLAINLVTADEMRLLHDIEHHYATTIPPLPENLSGL
jgi:superfamily II DNA/RNA helicase